MHVCSKQISLACLDGGEISAWPRQQPQVSDFVYVARIICLPGRPPYKLLFIRLIIHIFQFIFLAGTVFFSHNKSANSVFHPAYRHSRTGQSRHCLLKATEGCGDCMAFHFRPILCMKLYEV
jgi:hypothetical protein